ncbi:MAG TPA: M20 family metallopeptidase [Virgibacillus sp.]|nr:M20 family metallopeptidase [Virgibacillus sp.]HLR67545.1 M20 family metallopeptidase [Virgibacillus sp.]
MSNMNINHERANTFLQKLVKINTVNPPGNEYAIAKVISEHAENNNLKSKIKPLTNGRANIVIELEGKNPKLPPLVFSGHLDTVPVGEQQNWEKKPTSGELIDGKIHGRGSCDMKSGVAGLIEAMIHMKESDNLPEANITFIGTAGEEVDCIGAKAVIKDKIINNAGAMVIAEPSKNLVYSAHKGALWVEVIIYGKTAHGSMPSQGVNAIDYMRVFLERLNQLRFLNEKIHPLLGKPTLNVSTIEGGIQTNVVPDQCKVTVDIRTIPEIAHSEIVNGIQEILTGMETEWGLFHSELNILHDLPPLANKKNDTFVDLALHVNQEIRGTELLEKGANYYTDGSVFAPALDLPIIIYGPGDEKMAHQPNEYVDVDRYIEAIQYYISIARVYSKTQREVNSK